MRVAQICVRSAGIDEADLARLQAIEPDLIFTFGSVSSLGRCASTLTENFPQTHRIGCSTAGEITPEGVNDNSLAITAIAFEKSRVQQCSTELSGMEDSFAAGQRLANGLMKDGLSAVVLFGQGVNINGSALLAGMTEVLGDHVPITGGLAGDGGAFVRTLVLDDGGVSSTRIACVGLSGKDLIFTHGSFGGWQPFGPARKVTKCANNVLHELDGEIALDIYKRYLGDYAKDLPASGLLFPFAMLGSNQNELGLIRTILGVDEKSGSLTLAGDIDPQGYLRLMHASTDALVDGAESAATMAFRKAGIQSTGKEKGLVLMVSCVGRKLVMGDRVDEEIDAVADVFGTQSLVTGFYSYGEISPFGKSQVCRLNNQTMTVSYLSEVADS